MSSFVGFRCSRPTLRNVASAVLQPTPTFPASPPWRSFSWYRSRSEYGCPVQLALRIPSRPRQWHRTSRRFGVRTLFSDNVLKHYVDLPPNYKDQVGLPFARKDLDFAEVASLFGPGMNPAAANKLLRILHGRRIAGTMDDPAVQQNSRMFPTAQQKIALEYLRRTVPVDEVINAGLRAEDELAALDPEGLGGQTEPAVKDIGYTSRYKLYQASTPNEEGKIEPPTDVYGDAVIDRIRAANKAKWEEELKRREEEKRKRDEEEAEEARRNPAGMLQKADLNKPRELSPRMKEWRAAATELEDVPEMSKWARLAPSATVVVLLVGASLIYAQLYNPPEEESRLFPEVSPATATITTLVALNVLVWSAWKVPPLWRLMNRWFVLVPAAPRPLALLGAIFSHQKLTHLLPNMLCLWFLGLRLHDEIGRGDFLALYATSGAVGFLATMTSLVLRNLHQYSTIGASGAIYGVGTAYFWLHRFDAFKIFGLPPDPYNGVQGLGFIGLVASLNLAALVQRTQRLDIVSHLVGMLVGIVGAYLVERRAKERKEQVGGVTQTDLAVMDKVIEKN